MKHLTEEQLVMFYYGEEKNPASVEGHLADCEECRAALAAVEQALAQMTASPLPERGENYGREVWAALAPRLGAIPMTPQRASFWRELFAPRRWAVAAAMATLIVAAFLAGRFWPGGAPPKSETARKAEPAEAMPERTRERILLVAVGDHLNRSQMALMEIVNTRPHQGVDISSEQHEVEDLLAANRLYRQTASRSGEAGVASVLEELERVLIDIAHSPSRLSSREFEDLRRRVEAQGILFKVKVIDSNLERRVQGAS